MFSYLPFGGRLIGCLVAKAFARDVEGPGSISLMGTMCEAQRMILARLRDVMLCIALCWSAMSNVNAILKVKPEKRSF